MKGNLRNKITSKINQAAAAFGRFRLDKFFKQINRKDKPAEVLEVTTAKNYKKTIRNSATHKRRRKTLENSHFGNFRPVKSLQ